MPTAKRKKVVALDVTKPVYLVVDLTYNLHYSEKMPPSGERVSTSIFYQTNNLTAAKNYMTALATRRPNKVYHLFKDECRAMCEISPPTIVCSSDSTATPVKRAKKQA